jgi:3-hydroxyacyl-[acyl-carrier-protein] dehydratase
MAEMDIEAIKKMLPHRYPFLLVDRVLEMEEQRILALKNVTVNEEFFNGHFPGKPLMPGVLQVEALVQTGSILFARRYVEDLENSLIVFTGIKEAKFRQPVVPGDQLKMEVTSAGQRRNFAIMEGTARVDGDVVCELKASAAIVPRKEDT